MRFSVLEGAIVGTGCEVGPFARLREGAVLDDGAQVGNYVEVKASTLGRGAKAKHLTYLGNAEIGDGANIGAGTVTVNYDGYAKHTTTVGSGARIGSDTMLVAPVTVGRDAEHRRRIGDHEGRARRGARGRADRAAHGARTIGSARTPSTVAGAAGNGRRKGERGPWRSSPRSG